MTSLPYDKARCSGRMDFLPDGHWCKQRESCQRYLAFTQWDRDAGIPDYRSIPVVMALVGCRDKIEAGGDEWKSPKT